MQPNSAPPPRNGHSGMPPQDMTRQRHGMLRVVAGAVASTRNIALPPALTGVPNPNYNPNNSPFGWLDIVEVGILRLLGKEVDLLRLWNIVLNRGGTAKVR